MSRIRKPIPGVDPKLLIKDAGMLMPEPSRRLFLRGAASVGALAFLTGCDIIDGDTTESALRVVSRLNDRVQAFIFSPNKLALTYPESAITRPFPFNGYFYDEDEAPEVEAADYVLEVGGLVDNQKPWTLDELLRVAAGEADHAACLHRRLERDRKLDRLFAARVPVPRRRRHAGEICLVPQRRGLHQHDRHADCAASANADDVQVRERHPAAQIRVPDEIRMRTKRFQEPQAPDCDGGHQRGSRRLLGEPELRGI